MRIVTVMFMDKEVQVIKCESTCWGDQSRNLYLRNVTQPERADFLVLPLHNVRSFLDKEA